MMTLGVFPLGKVVPCTWNTYSGSTGASITSTGISLAKMKLYKGISMTERASTSGFALMNTTGIDLDGITGWQGVSIDTSDNSDPGFFTAGAFYTLVIQAVTVDAQTVSLIADRWYLTTADVAVDSAGRVNLQPAQAGVTIGNVTNVGTVTGNVTGNVNGNVVGNVNGTVNAVAGLNASLLDVAVSTRTAGGTYVTPPTAAAVALAVLTTQMVESYAADGAAPTLTQAVMLIQQVLTEFNIVSTNNTIRKLDGATQAAVLNYNDATNPSSSTRVA